MADNNQKKLEPTSWDSRKSLAAHILRAENYEKRLGEGLGTERETDFYHKTTPVYRRLLGQNPEYEKVENLVAALKKAEIPAEDILVLLSDSELMNVPSTDVFFAIREGYIKNPEIAKLIHKVEEKNPDLVRKDDFRKKHSPHPLSRFEEGPYDLADTINASTQFYKAASQYPGDIEDLLGVIRKGELEKEKILPLVKSPLFFKMNFQEGIAEACHLPKEFTHELYKAIEQGYGNEPEIRERLNAIRAESEKARTKSLQRRTGNRIRKKNE